MDKKSLASIKPLLFGRLTRVVFGIGTLAVIPIVGVGSLGAVGTALLGFLGVSFLLGGIMGNPGCELTAIPNLFLSRGKRVHTL